MTAAQRKRRMTASEREAIFQECQNLKSAGVPRNQWRKRLQESPRLQGIDWSAIDWAAILKLILSLFAL